MLFICLFEYSTIAHITEKPHHSILIVNIIFVKITQAQTTTQSYDC